MFNQSQLAARPSGMYNPTDTRSRRGIFTNAGLSISGGQDDSIQHNYRYQVDREKLKREAEAAEINKLRRFQSEANFETLSRAQPNAFKSYSNNLDKISHNVDRVDAYANEVQSAKERLFRDQQNILNLQKLNRLNADQHKQHHQSQLLKIREPVRNNDFPPMRAHPRSGDSIVDSRTHLSEADQDLKLSMLDRFSLNNGLDDQLSAFNQAAGGMTGRSNGPDMSRDYGEMSRYMGGNERRVPTSTFYQGSSLQTSPLLPQHQTPYLQHAFNASVVPHSQFYQSPPGYAYNPPAPSNDNHELKNYMQQQTALLERISDKISKRKDVSRDRQRRSSKEIENRFKDFEKEAELRLQLMKQQQTIENLQNLAAQPRQRPEESRNSRYRDRDPPKSQKQDPYMPQATHSHSHSHPQSQSDLFSPQGLTQNFMQYMNPFQNNTNPLLNPYFGPNSYDAYLNAYAYGAYPTDPYNMFSPYPIDSRSKSKKKDKKKKKKKSKSKRRGDSSDEDEESDSEKSQASDDSDEDDKRSKKKGGKDKKSKDKKSKDKDKDKDKGKGKDKKGKDEGMTEERKKKAKSNLKSILWTIAYQKIFNTDISQKVGRRRAAHQQHVNQNQDAFAQNFATWLMNVTQEGFTRLFDDAKKTYDFAGLDFKKPGRSDIVKRATEAKKQTKFLIDTLVAKTDANANEIKDADLEYLAEICYGNIYVADNTFSTFELQRMKWNYWGRNSEMTKEHSQMIICASILIRILIYQLIFKANEWNNKVKWTPQALANFKIVGSLLYRICYSMFEELLPVVSEKPSEAGYIARANLTIDPVMAPIDENRDNPEMIFGVVSKAQLAPVLEEDKPWADSIKELIWNWTLKMHQKVAEYRAKNPAKEPISSDNDPRVGGEI